MANHQQFFTLAPDIGAANRVTRGKFVTKNLQFFTTTIHVYDTRLHQTVWPRHCLVECLVSGKWSNVWSRHWCRHNRVTRGECVTNHLQLFSCVTTWLPSFPPDVAPITTIHMCDKQHSYQVFQTLCSKLTFPLCPITLHKNTKPCWTFRKTTSKSFNIFSGALYLGQLCVWFEPW